jgi:hypothetical protein
MFVVNLTEDHFLCRDMSSRVSRVSPQHFLEWMHLIDMVFGDCMWSEVYPKLIELVKAEQNLPDVSSETFYELGQSLNLHYFHVAWDMAQTEWHSPVNGVPSNG